MQGLSEDIVHFFRSQSFVIVSTIDKQGLIHNSCKGIVKINQTGQVYLLDLYKANTHENLKANPIISLTAVDEHKFRGYSLKGRAKILPAEKIQPQIITAWEERIASRLSRRVLRNMHDEKGHPKHPEVLLPQPEYMIAMEVEEILDLTPHPLR